MYFIVNIAVAVILDRKRLSVALISHIVMFSVMSVFVLFCSGVEFISQAAMRLLGADAYEILLSAMCFGETELLLPIVIIQLVLTLQFALVTAAFTCEVIHYLQARKPRQRAKRPNYASQARVNTTLPGQRTRVSVVAENATTCRKAHKPSRQSATTKHNKKIDRGKNYEIYK